MSKYADALLYGKKENKLIVFEALGVPGDTIDLDEDAKEYPHIALINDQLWIWSVDQQNWLDLFNSAGDLITERVVLTAGGNSYEITDGQMAYNFIIRPAEGDTIKIGTTDGGDEIMLETELIADKAFSVNKDVIADGENILIYVSGITTDLMMTIYKRKL